MNSAACKANVCLWRFAELFLLVSVLSKPLLTLVRSHFVFLSFLSARHINVLILFFPL